MLEKKKIINTCIIFMALASFFSIINKFSLSIIITNNSDNIITKYVGSLIALYSPESVLTLGLANVRIL